MYLIEVGELELGFLQLTSSSIILRQTCWIRDVQDISQLSEGSADGSVSVRHRFIVAEAGRPSKQEKHSRDVAGSVYTGSVNTGV